MESRCYAATSEPHQPLIAGSSPANRESIDLESLLHLTVLCQRSVANIKRLHDYPSAMTAVIAFRTSTSQRSRSPAGLRANGRLTVLRIISMAQRCEAIRVQEFFRLPPSLRRSHSPSEAGRQTRIAYCAQFLLDRMEQDSRLGPGSIRRW